MKVRQPPAADVTRQLAPGGHAVLIHRSVQPDFCSEKGEGLFRERTQTADALRYHKQGGLFSHEESQSVTQIIGQKRRTETSDIKR